MFSLFSCSVNLRIVGIIVLIEGHSVMNIMNFHSNSTPTFGAAASLTLSSPHYSLMLCTVQLYYFERCDEIHDPTVWISEFYCLWFEYSSHYIEQTRFFVVIFIKQDVFALTPSLSHYCKPRLSVCKWQLVWLFALKKYNFPYPKAEYLPHFKVI